MRFPVVGFAIALVVSALSGSACGTVAVDCSGATPDGAGNCIPYDHGPQPAQQAAFRYFGDRVDQVACCNHGRFHFRGRGYHAWGCKAIRGGHLQNDVIYCVFLRRGVALTPGEVSALHWGKRRCD